MFQVWVCWIGCFGNQFINKLRFSFIDVFDIFYDFFLVMILKNKNQVKF